MILSEYSKMKAFVADIVEMSDLGKAEKIIEDIIQNCNDVEFIRGVLYFYSHDGKRMNEVLNKAEELLISRLNNMIDNEEDILKTKQQKYGFWCFQEYLDKNVVRNYYLSLVKKDINNLPNLLEIFVITSYSVSGKTKNTKYSFNLKEFNEFFNKKEIKELVDTYLKTGQKTLSIKLFLNTISES